MALGFADRDDEIRAEMERQQIAERDNAVITGLSDDFGCVVYVDLDTNDEIHYRFDPMFEKNIPGWSSINNYSDRLKTLNEKLVHPDDRGEFFAKTRKESIIEALKNDSVYYVNFRTKVGKEITYYQAKYIMDSKTNNHLVTGFRNVDAETKRELEALDKAETANRAKTDFLFNMSHDIRTPMNAIIGFTNMALRDIHDADKASESLKKSQNASDMLLSIINDILDMSRIESGKVNINEDKGEIDQTFSGIESMMRELAECKNIDISFLVENIIHNQIYVDIPRTERILVNVVSNAIKYTEEGGKVEVSCSEIPYNVSGYALFRYIVRDNGIGMSEEFLAKCFEEFAREENSTTSGIQGTGLGLPLAKALTELMHGSITCESTQGVGSVFTIDLPFRIQSAEDLKDAVLDRNNHEGFDFRGRNVLLVEDNELNREIAVDLLREDGMIVTEAVDGKDAILKVKQHDMDFFDCILMDIQMPFMNGYEAAKIIREMYPERHIPIIALSANAFEEDKIKSREAGMDDHVAKPIKTEILRKVMAKYI